MPTTSSRGPVRVEDRQGDGAARRRRAVGAPDLRRALVTDRVVVTVDHARRAGDRGRDLDEVVGRDVAVERHRHGPGLAVLRRDHVAGVRAGGAGEADDRRHHDTGDESGTARPAACDTNNSFHNVSQSPFPDARLRPIKAR